VIVLWRVTERCNLSCSFCAYDRRLPGARRDIDEATVQRFGSVLADYRRATGERVLLSWLGGEPLLWRPVFEMSRQLRHEHGIEVSATTNGSTLHLPKTVLGILDSFSELTVSVDGLAAFHEQVRGCPGGWQRLRSAVQSLVQARNSTHAKLKVRVNIVLMRDNLAEFAALCTELADWQIDEITFNQLGGRDRPEFFPAHSLRPQDVMALRTMLPELRATMATRGVRLCASELYLQRIEASAERRALPVADCAPGERFLFIDETGRVSPCSFTAADYGEPVESIRNAADLIDLPSRYRVARAGARAKVCSDCPSTHVFAKFAV
jgi:MoaA/NifB/PqqE/SkfB family radical SAM enzyme